MKVVLLNIQRILQLPDLTKEKTSFLFGPRSTGKTFCIRQQLGADQLINLLRAEERRRYIENPSLLGSHIKGMDPSLPVVIDEIQLVPELLNEVQHLIETTQYRFLLTGQEFFDELWSV